MEDKEEDIFTPANVEELIRRRSPEAIKTWKRKGELITRGWIKRKYHFTSDVALDRWLGDATWNKILELVYIEAKPLSLWDKIINLFRPLKKHKHVKSSTIEYRVLK